MILAVQYLEGNPETRRLNPEAVRARLHYAIERLPIAFLLLGWDLPDSLIDACAEECQRAHIQMIRWQPLLTGAGDFRSHPDWQVMGLHLQPISGFRNLPEFTFVCPNRHEVQQAVGDHLQTILKDDRFQGIFLDRIRFPSPAPDPGALLGCFCNACHQTAAAQGIDLSRLRRQIRRLMSTPDGAVQVMDLLLNPAQPGDLAPEPQALAALLQFRASSISRFVQQAAALARHSGLSVGLDCFSTSLTRMVGQDLAALDACCDWIKIMVYGHTMAPAGIPYELLGLANWLITQHGFSEAEALRRLASASRLALPGSRTGLEEQGLSSDALRLETERARTAGVTTLLAGIELVDLPGVTRLSPAQIASDLAAFRQAGADGLALSWDLWHIRPDRLELVRQYS